MICLPAGHHNGDLSIFMRGIMNGKVITRVRNALFGGACTLTLALGTVAAFGGVADAAPGHPQLGKKLIGKFKIHYNQTWKFKSRPLKACMFLTATGTVSYKLYLLAGVENQSYEWTDQIIHAPRLTANIHYFSNGSCSGPSTLSKLTLGQAWAGYSCSFNPQVSISYPFGLSLGAWPSCHSRNQASDESTFDTTSAFYEQATTRSPVDYGNYSATKTKYHPCYGVYATAIGYQKNISDAFGPGQSASRKVCLTKA